MRLLGLLAILAASLAVGCDDPGRINTDAGGGPSTCVLDTDCPNAEACRDGFCTPSLFGDDDAGQVDPDAGPNPDPDADAGALDAGPELRGILDALPSTFVEFGAQALATPVERNVTLSNIGNAPLTVLQIVLDENDTGEFTATPTGAIGQELLPGEGLNLVLTHTPIDGAPDDATVRIVHTADSEGFFELNLFAEFKGSSELSITDQVAVLEPSLETLDMGQVPVGVSNERTIWLRNRGSGDSVLTLDNLVITPQSAGFTMTSPALSEGILGKFSATCDDGLVEGCPAAASVCTDQVCLDEGGNPLGAFPITLTFLPDAPGDAEATLTVAHDADGPNTETDIALVGFGSTGELVTLPSAVVFNDAFVGLTQSQNLVLENVGAAPLSLEGFEVNGVNPPFALAHSLTLPHELLPSESVVVEVQFTPVVQGEATRVLTILTGEEEPPTVDFYGLSREPGSAIFLDPLLSEITSQSLLPFGDIYVGTTVQAEILVANLGPGDLAVTRMEIEGPAAARYSFSPTSFANDLPPVFNGSTYEPNAPLTLSYQPSSITGAPDLATLIVETDDPNYPVFEMELSGRAIQPVIEVTPTTIDFGPMTVGGPDGVATFTIRNTGFGPLTLAEITAPPETQFSVSPSGVLNQPMLAADGPLTVTVTFVPDDTVYRTTTLQVISDDLADNDVTVAVAGGGLMCPTRANAQVAVDPNNGDCLYTCNSGFHECGSACLSNSSPNSCGNSCSPCATRNDADRGCVAATGQCTYSCVDQHYDLNMDLTVAQGTFSNGCEYECDVATPTSESCNDLDDDCDGVPDDGLAGDSYEGVGYNGNDTSSTRYNLGDINEGQAAATFIASLYPFPAVGGTDVDWYRIRAKEDSNFCPPFIGDEDFKTTFLLENIPAGTDYDLYIYTESGTYLTSSLNVGNADESIEYIYDGQCGSNDDKGYLIRVVRWGSSGDCGDYHLIIQHEEI